MIENDIKIHIKNCKYKTCVCKYCNSRIYINNKELHYKNCKVINRKVSCLLCNFVFSNIIDFNNHYSDNNSNPECLKNQIKLIKLKKEQNKVLFSKKISELEKLNKDLVEKEEIAKNNEMIKDSLISNLKEKINKIENQNDINLKNINDLNNKNKLLESTNLSLKKELNEIRQENENT